MLSPDIDSYYNRIGIEALALAPEESGKVLVYSEIESGMSTCGIFYQSGSDITSLKCSRRLDDLIYDFWEAWKSRPDYSEWRGISFSIVNTQFDVSFIYPESIDEDEPIWERRPRIVRSFFGDLNIVDALE